MRSSGLRVLGSLPLLAFSATVLAQGAGGGGKSPLSELAAPGAPPAPAAAPSSPPPPPPASAAAPSEPAPPPPPGAQPSAPPPPGPAPAPGAQPPAPGAPYEPPAPRQGERLQFAPIAPPPSAGVREHDGFHLRMALGFSYLMFDLKEENDKGRCQTSCSSIGTVRGRGPGGAFEIAMGGTVARGLVIGGVITVDAVGDAKIDKASGPRGGELRLRGVDASALGIFLDWYPQPKEGWHVRGTVAFAAFHMEDSRSTHQPDSGVVPEPDIPDHSAGGLAAALAGGYDFWVADQWSIGPLARITYTSTVTEDDRWSHRSWSPALLVAGTYQ